MEETEAEEGAEIEEVDFNEETGALEEELLSLKISTDAMNVIQQSTLQINVLTDKTRMKRFTPSNNKAAKKHC